ncbi:MAG TPA: HD domain-containing protein [Bacillota bacterium]
MWWLRLVDLLRFRLSRYDQVFVKSYLNEAGQFLFNQMSVADQAHSIRVARYIIDEVAVGKDINLDCLVQAALLHDVGKVKGEIGRINRILVGIIRRFFPRKREQWGRRDKTSALRYALYVDAIHPSRGGYMAESMGINPQVVALIKRHHDPDSAEDDTPELSLLKLADAKS